MTWFIASLPLWLLGILFFTLGAYGIGAIALHEGTGPRFKTADDGNAFFIAVCLVMASALFFMAAAKIYS